jgi:hypothetical protein
MVDVTRDIHGEEDTREADHEDARLPRPDVESEGASGRPSRDRQAPRGLLGSATPKATRNARTAVLWKSTSATL